MKDILGNERLWRDLDEDGQAEYARSVFDHYRDVGFPFYSTDKEYRDNEFRKLMAYDGKVLVGDVVKQTMHGLALAWSYFPHSFDVRCNGKLTPFEVFHDDEKFMKVIRKRMKIGTYMQDSGIRKMLKMYTGVQGVSNFRPTAAAAIYDKYAKGGVVWDMCCGWGGRLLGAIKSGVGKYIGTEPSTLTYQGLSELAMDYGMSHIEIDLYKQCAEAADFPDDQIDLCFTSPPYFNLEMYAIEDTQSAIKFPTYDKWKVGFLRGMIQKCYDKLRPRGFMVLNIGDHRRHPIVTDSVTVSESVGFTYMNIIKLALSNPKFSATGFKHEPVLIFRK